MAFTLHDESEIPKQQKRAALGRPYLYNEETVSKILYALQKGSTYKLAAQYAGISYECFHHWKRDSQEKGELSPFYPFHLMVEENVARGSVRALAIIESAAEHDWKAAAWRISHNPFTRQDYSDKVEVTGKDGAPLIGLGALRALLPDEETDSDDDFAENVVSFDRHKAG